MIVALAAAVGGCGTRALLLMDPPAHTRMTGTGTGTETGTGTGTGTGAGTGAGTGTGTGAGTGTGTAMGAWDASGIVWSRLPAPHLAPRSKTPVATPTTIEAARVLIGARDPRSSFAFALAVAGGLTDTHALPDVADGPALVAWATPRGGLIAIAPPTTEPPALAAGDLLVFDRAVGGAPASLIAVVVTRDPRGVIEMLYLAGGVIRRGFVDPSRPKTSRDRDRRVVNSFLRHGADQPPAGTRYRAGELLVAGIRLGR